MRNWLKSVLIVASLLASTGQADEEQISDDLPSHVSCDPESCDLHGAFSFEVSTPDAHELPCVLTPDNLEIFNFPENLPLDESICLEDDEASYALCTNAACDPGSSDFSEVLNHPCESASEILLEGAFHPEFCGVQEHSVFEIPAHLEDETLYELPESLTYPEDDEFDEHCPDASCYPEAEDTLLDISDDSEECDVPCELFLEAPCCPVLADVLNDLPCDMCCFFGGPYIGAHVGWNSYSTARTDDGQTIYFSNYQTYSANHTDWEVGMRAGYDWLRSCKLFGLIADLTWTEARTWISLEMPGTPIDLFEAKARMQWFTTFRARMGYLFNETFLFYLAGGAALAEFKNSLSNNGSTPPSFTFKNTRWGWTLGFGSEWAVSSHWSIWAEVLYTSFPMKRMNFIANGSPSSFTFFDNSWSGRLGLNYHFSLSGRDK